VLLRIITFALSLSPAMAVAGHVAPSAPDSVSTFVQAANQLPCPARIGDMAGQLGYRFGATSDTGKDYSETAYEQIDGHAALSVALERTPLGAQFSVTLETPQTNPGFADRIIAELRTALSLPAPVAARDLTRGSAHSWQTVTLTGGSARIIVRQLDDTTQIFALLAPQAPGTIRYC
jgi:hypothetical protein